jgi:hypothetical protein
MKHRTEGHTQTEISGDTRADWSDAFALVPSLEVAYVWHASKFTREVLDGLLRIGFLHHQQIIWNKGRTVLTRTHYWFQHEPCWYVRKKNAPWYGKPGENSTIWDSPSPKFIMGGSDEEKLDHPTQKPVALMRRPILNHTKLGELVYEPFLGSGTTLAAAVVAVESPVFWLEAARRIADSAGIQRLGSRIQDAFRVACDVGTRAGRFTVRGEFLWRTNMAVPEIRDRSDLQQSAKKIEHVAPEEIQVAIERVVQESYGIAADDVATNPLGAGEGNC